MNGDNLGSRLWALIARPGQAMVWVGEKPQWLVAGLILFVTFGLFTALTAHIAGPEQMELMRDTRFGQMMPQEEWEQQYEESLNPTVVKRLLTGLSGGFGTWISVFIYGLVFLLFSKLAGGQATFKQVMGVTFWGFLLPYVLGSWLKLPLIYAKESLMGVSIGLAALAPNADLLSAQYQALSFFGDFFVWWGLVLLIIGIGKVDGFATGKAATVVLLPWLLVTGAMFILGRLFI